MKRAFALIVFGIFSMFGLMITSSYAEVIVSSSASTEETLVHYDIGPGQYVAIPLPSSSTKDDNYSLKVVARNKVYKDITAYLVDEQNLKQFKQGQAYRGLGYSRVITPITITGSTQTPGQKYILLDNSYAGFMTKKMDVYITATLPVGEGKAQELKDSFTKMYEGLKSGFIFKDFNIHIEPCGQVNAFSESSTTGDIHICTELMDNIEKSKNTGALYFIFLHELGHTLLGLWNLPGNNNEDMADEFATYVMLQGGAFAGIQLERSLDFWRNRDATAEAINMIQNGDRHSLSVQRIRNIDENIRNSRAFNMRWSQQIYPHMTTQALQDTIKSPSENSNIDLAKATLVKRGVVIPEVEKTGNSSQAAPSIAQRLKKLDALHKDGLLTEKEYRTKREKILGEL